MSRERATKKQQELLQYIQSFISEHDYGPSYREIMRALDYRSVSTVAVHVEGLIAKGFLRRKDNTARSLEVIMSGSSAEANQAPVAKTSDDIVRVLKKRLKEFDGSETATVPVTTLIEALKLVERKDEAREFEEEFHKIQKTEIV